MDGDRQAYSEPTSPLDQYISQAIAAIADSASVSSSSLAQLLTTQLGWLPGFADVILSALRTNGLIVVNDWEPGKVHITHRGRRWLDSSLIPQ
jgi:hypothetical protein